MNNENQITPPSDATDKQEHLLSVAEGLFAEHGFDGTSIRMIAEQSGMNVAMVSYYFGSKEKMFEQLIARRIAHMKSMADQLAQDSPGNPWEKMQLLIDGYVERLTQSKANFHKLMMREMSLGKRPDIVQAIEQRLISNMKTIHNVVQTGIDEGIFRPDVDFMMVMLMVFGTLTHATSSHNLALRCAALELENKTEMDTPEEARRRIRIGLNNAIGRYMLVNPAKYNLH